VVTADWVRVQSIQTRSLIPLLRTELDEGEAEAIALAQEVAADIVLLDERDARRVARRLGLQVVGTVGLLIEAKCLGRLVNLREQFDALQTQGKFRLSRQLFERALREGGK
jgi:uncharacterized protein